MSHSFWPHGLQHTRPPCPSPTPWVYSNSRPLSQWCHPTISFSVVPFFSCPQSAAAAAAKSLQSCLTLCDPMDCSLPGFSVHVILQARTLEWVAMPSSRRFSWPRDQTCVSCGLLHGRWIPYHWASFIYLYLAYLFFFGVPLLYNVVLVSAVK